MLGAEKFMAAAARRFFRGIAVEAFCATIPVNDLAWKFPHDDGVMGLVQQGCLPLKILFRPLAFGYGVVGFQRPDWAALLIALPRPTARHDDLRAVALAVHQLTIPAAGAEQGCVNLFERFGKDR